MVDADGELCSDENLLGRGLAASEEEVVCRAR